MSYVEPQDNPDINDPPFETPIDPPAVHSYTIKTNINFTVKATSITAAYKQFEKWIVAKFEEAYANEVKNPIIVPNWYEGLSVEKDSK